MNIGICQSYDTDDLGEQENLDEEEQTEYLEVWYNVEDHSNQMSNPIVNLQEEECLVDLHQENNRKHKLTFESLWLYIPLEDYIRNTTDNVNHIKIVANFTEVICQAWSVHLREVIICWIDDTNEKKVFKYSSYCRIF